MVVVMDEGRQSSVLLGKEQQRSQCGVQQSLQKQQLLCLCVVVLVCICLVVVCSSGSSQQMQLQQQYVVVVVVSSSNSNITIHDTLSLYALYCTYHTLYTLYPTHYTLPTIHYTLYPLPLLLLQEAKRVKSAQATSKPVDAPLRVKNAQLMVV